MRAPFLPRYKFVDKSKPRFDRFMKEYFANPINEEKTHMDGLNAWYKHNRVPRDEQVQN